MLDYRKVGDPDAAAESAPVPHATTSLVGMWSSLAHGYLDLLNAGGNAIIGCVAKSLQRSSVDSQEKSAGSNDTWSVSVTLHQPAPASGVTPRTDGFELLTDDVRITPDKVRFDPVTLLEGESSFDVIVERSALPTGPTVLRAVITDAKEPNGAAICDTVRIPTPLQERSSP